ncbi:MAG TPA: NADH-quinone oxidoreductase subunit C, partial [Candidatus Margulisiibacteriota bacterium]|nr:NADH-quinone oxidoreductase subunit C [Candidatus Margulisiibacteriota bacterium]
MPATPPVYNGAAVNTRDVPELAVAEFREAVIRGVDAGARIAAFFGQSSAGGHVRLIAVLAQGDTGTLDLLSTVVGETYPALTPDCTQAHWFEREIAEQWNVQPTGHPWLKPIRSP